MRRFSRKLGGLFVLASLVLSFTAVVAHAQQPLTITMTPTADRGTGLAGTVTVTPAGTNQVKVDIRITGLKPDDERSAHIHSPGTGTDVCDTGGPVVYPLTNVKADASGVGTSTTNVTFDPAKGIPTTGWYFNVHVGAGANTGLGVICGKGPASLTAAAGAAPAAAASPAAGAAPAAAAPAARGALPATGNGGPASTNGMLIAVLALAGIALGSMGFVLSRRSS